MSDDLWKPDGDDKPRPQFGEDWDLSVPSFDDSAELGAPLPSSGVRDLPPPAELDDEDDFGDFTDGLPPLKFGDDGSAMPDWRNPPTGEVPSLFADPVEGVPAGDVDVWSSFAGADSSSPVVNPWGDDETQVDGVDFTGVPKLGALDESPAPENMFFEEDETSALVQAKRPVREPIQIGTDPTSPPSPAGDRGHRTGPRPTAKGPVRSDGSAAGGVGGRNMPMAIAAGLVIAAVFFGLVKVGPVAVLGLIVAVLLLAAVEFYDKTAERGYRPVRPVGIAACALMPIAAYFQGERGILLAIVLAFIASIVAAMTYDGIESGPLPNTAVTMLGIGWIGVLGSFGAMILKHGHEVAQGLVNGVTDAKLHQHVGTDTLVYLAIGVVATDVGALFVGSMMGKTPLRRWISPNKTVEGLVGGIIITIAALFIAKIVVGDKASTWYSTPSIVILAVVIAIMAPIGDLAESMFKRNLDIKDFGTLVPGHGGVLDRFDGFLFALPTVYYLLTTLQPYTDTLPVVKK